VLLDVLKSGSEKKKGIKLIKLPFILTFRELRIKELLKKRSDSQAEESDEEEFPDMEFDKGLKIPGKIWHKLFK